MSEYLIVLGALLFVAGILINQLGLTSNLTVYLKNIPYVEKISGKPDVILIILGFLLMGLGCYV